MIVQLEHWTGANDLIPSVVKLDQRIHASKAELKDYVRAHEAARCLIAIPGIGVLNTTSLTAAIGEGSAFVRGRNLASWPG